MYASVSDWNGVTYVVRYTVSTCLVLAVVLAAAPARPAALSHRLHLALEGLRGLRHRLAQVVALLHRSATNHLRARLHYVSNPRTSTCLSCFVHFCLTARNESRTTLWSRAEVPLASVCVHVVHDFETRKRLVRCDDDNVLRSKPS